VKEYLWYLPPLRVLRGICRADDLIGVIGSRALCLPRFPAG
jgi:hypothetical protein